MENSTMDEAFIESIINDPQFNFELLDSMLFSNAGMLNGATDQRTLANPDHSMTATPQNLTANNQEPLSNPDNKPFPTGQPDAQIHISPIEELSETEVIQVRKLLDAIGRRLQEVERELVTVKGQYQTTQSELYTVKGQYQTTQSELYTVKSNHMKLLRWTMDMGEALKALGKGLAKNTGADIVFLDGLMEEMVSG